MSGGHTPGPWEWQTPMGESAPWIVPAGLKAYEWDPIAMLGDCLEDLPRQSKAHQTVIANANLIAAAPDLLETLAEAMGILARAESNASGNPEFDYVGPRVAAARAAIAKARGQ